MYHGGFKEPHRQNESSKLCSCKRSIWCIDEAITYYRDGWNTEAWNTSCPRRSCSCVE